MSRLFTMDRKFVDDHFSRAGIRAHRFTKHDQRELQSQRHYGSRTAHLFKHERCFTIDAQPRRSCRRQLQECSARNKPLGGFRYENKDELRADLVRPSLQWKWRLPCGPAHRASGKHQSDRPPALELSTCSRGHGHSRRRSLQHDLGFDSLQGATQGHRRRGRERRHLMRRPHDRLARARPLGA